MGQLRRLLSLGTLRAAWARVRARNAGPGIDGVTVADYAANVDERLATFAVALEVDQWRPRPGRKVRLADDPERPIVVACVEDRIVQRALADVLTPHFERRLSPAARAYRPGHALDATLQWVSRHLRDGRQFFLRTDVRKFFDEIDRVRLLERLAEQGVEPKLVSLVERLLRAGAVEGSFIQDSGLGVGQGSALSPLLSNVYLGGVDEAVLGAGFAYVRYADDILVLGDTDAHTEDALALLNLHLESERLTLNLRKARRGHLRDGFAFLGAYFDVTGRSVATSVMDAVADRAAAAANSTDAARTLADTVDELAHWYGELPVERMPTLPLVAGWTLRSAGEGEDNDRFARAARRRLGLPATERLDAATRAALVERWAMAAQAMPSSGEVRRAMLLDARGALQANPSPEVLSTLADALGLEVERLPLVVQSWDAVALALEASGRRSLAWAARQLGAPEPAEDNTPPPESPPHEAPEELLSAILDMWRGRDGCHALETVADDGHLMLVTQRGALSVAAFRGHLAGAQRVGLHLVRADDTVMLACFESHARRDAVVVSAGAGPTAASPHETLNLLMHRVHDDAIAIGRGTRPAAAPRDIAPQRLPRAHGPRDGAGVAAGGECLALNDPHDFGRCHQRYVSPRGGRVAARRPPRRTADNTACA